MFDRHALHADPFTERSNKIDRPAAQRTGDRVLVILRNIGALLECGRRGVARRRADRRTVVSRSWRCA